GRILVLRRREAAEEPFERARWCVEKAQRLGNLLGIGVRDDRDPAVAWRHRLGRPRRHRALLARAVASALTAGTREQDQRETISVHTAGTPSSARRTRRRPSGSRPSSTD